MHTKVPQYLYILAALEIDSKEKIFSIHTKIFVTALFMVNIQKYTPKYPEKEEWQIQSMKYDSKSDFVDVFVTFILVS